MYILFLDETGDHSLEKIDLEYPVFCLAGCIFDETYYFGQADGMIDALKEKHFNDTDIVLHSYDIRKQKPPFESLREKVKRDAFVSDMNQLMTDLDFTIIASCIKKIELLDEYLKPGDPYDLSLTFIMERYLKFLIEQDEVGYVSVESRDPKSNRDLSETFSWCMNNGTKYCPAVLFQKHITKIEFITKAENENGHQICDLVAYPTARFCLEGRISNPAFEIIKDKFRRSGDRIRGFGYKEFPR